MTPRDIAQIRRWFGKSQAEFGKLIGAYNTVVCQMETARRPPTASQLKRLLALRRRMMREMAAKVNAAE